ncbi:MAG: hypothetical protein J6N92_04240 [Alloprevotella sp.]|nr:hypothetical protein [Alloprevotella sp.]
MENKRYNIELEVVTPLCVGAGGENDWVKGADYVEKDGKVYVIDLKWFYDEIGKDGIDKLSQAYATSNMDGILSLIGNKLESVSRYIFDSPATSENPIKTFLRTQLYNRPLIAGTSLKGAIRSALFKEFRPEGPKDRDSKENEKAFGGIQDNLMKFLQVGDIEMAETTLVNTKVFSLIGSGDSWDGGWKDTLNGKNSRTYNPQGFNTLYECVCPGETGFGTITYAVNAATSKVSEKQRLQQGGIEELFRIINQRTRDYLRKERAFFIKYQADRSAEIIDCIDELSEELDKMMLDNKSCLLKMSAGVGFHSITGDWQCKDYTNTGFYGEKHRHAGKKKYKSRKIAEYEGELYLMGFVALHLLSDKEAKERRSSLDETHTAIQQKHIARLQEAAEAEARRKAEAEAKQRAKEQERARQAKFDALFQEAKDLNVAGNLDEAIAKLNEALALLSNDVDALKLLAEVKKRQENQASIKKIEEAAAKRLSGSLADVFEGKSIGALGTLIATTQKWLKANPEVSIGDAEYEAIKKVVTNFPKNEKRNIKKNSKKLIEFLGQDRADELVGTF